MTECPDCGAPVSYEAHSAVYLHDRERIDQFDNGYACADKYRPMPLWSIDCPKCGGVTKLWAHHPILGPWATCVHCRHPLDGQTPVQVVDGA